MNESEFVFSLVYSLLTIGIIYPPTEFVAVGLTINNLFGSFLGSIDIEFIQYHLRRTCLTLFIHSILPLFYAIWYYLNFGSVIEYDVHSFLRFILWNSFIIFAFVLPVVTIGVIFYWCKDDFANHPIAQNLRKYNRDSWLQTATDINTEYRRDDKINIQTSAVHSVVATQNWIIKTSNYMGEIDRRNRSDSVIIPIGWNSDGKITVCRI